MAIFACGGDTFTHAAAGDSGAGLGADGGGGCAPGLSKSAFCSSFDQTHRVEDDGWTAVSAASGQDNTANPQIYTPARQAPTSPPNVLYVKGDVAQAYVKTNRPNAPKHFKFAFDAYMLSQGSFDFVPVRVAACSSADASNCYALSLDFAASHQLSLDEAAPGGASPVHALDTLDMSAIDGNWSRVVLDVTLRPTGSGGATANVTLGKTQSVALSPPASVIDHIDHIELDLGAVTAEGAAFGYVYELYYDTVTFDPDPP